MENNYKWTVKGMMSMNAQGIKVALFAPNQSQGLAITQVLERMPGIATVAVHLDDGALGDEKYYFRGKRIQPVNEVIAKDHEFDWIIYAGKAYKFNAFYAQVEALSVPVLNLSWGQGVDSLIGEAQAGMIVQSSNPITQQLMPPLRFIHERFGINALNLFVGFSVETMGDDGLSELLNQTFAYMSGVNESFYVFPKPIAFNTLSTVEVDETTDHVAYKRLLNKEIKFQLGQAIDVELTLMQMSTLKGHHVSVHVLTDKSIDLKEISRYFESHEEIHHTNMLNNRESGEYFDQVAIGQLAKHPSHEHGLSFHIIANELNYAYAKTLKQAYKNLISSIEKI
jgi:hypothetical protein